MNGEINLWEAIGNGCLKHALKITEANDALNDEHIGQIKKLVDIALSINELNYRPVQQNPF